MRTLLLAISAALVAISPLAASELGRPGVGAQGAIPPDSVAGAPTDWVDVRPIRSGPAEAEPRRVLTRLFFVTNNSSTKLQVSPRVGLPDGWQVITGDSTITLDAHQRSVSLVSVLVPRRAAPKDYGLTYIMSVVGRPEILAWCAVPVTVLPITKLDVRSLAAPDFVVAGEDYKASFAVSNRGNITTTVALRAQTAAALPFVPASQTLVMSPGETKRIELSLRTDPEMRKAIRDNLILVAEVAEPKTEAHAASPVEIIPRVTGVEDRFERIPSLLAFRDVISRNGSTRSRFQGELSGEGTFGAGGRNQLTFLAKGPDIQRIGVLGRRDEYFLTYSTDRYDIVLGDRTYTVSQLSENNRYGRGLEARANLGQFKVGAHGLRNAPEEPSEEQAAAFVDYAPNGATEVGLNYLVKRKDETSQIIGLEGKLTPGWNTNVEMEYSAGLEDRHDRNAYYLKLHTLSKRASGFLRLIHADAAYPGYFRDMDFVAGVADVILRPTSKLDASFRQERHNLAEDQQISTVPTEREYQIRLDQTFEAADVSVGWRTRVHGDKLSQPVSDYVENVVRPSIGQRFERWNYYTAIETGWIDDREAGTRSSLRRATGSLNIRPTSHQAYGCYLSYDTSHTPGKTRRSYLTVGVSGSMRIRTNTMLDLGFRSNDYEDGRSIESDMLDLTLSHRLPNKSTVLLRGYYRPWESASSHDELAASIEYSVPVGVPVAKRLNVGTVKGYVYDELTGRPLENVILRLDGTTAVTDLRGNFMFPSVAKGDYYLRVDKASIGLDRIALEKLPIELSVEGGKENMIQIGVTQSASLHGKVMLYRPSAAGSMPSSDAKPNLVEDKGLANVLVELSDGVETKRVLTDDVGRFGFEEMRPGSWTLKIAEDNLPDYTALEKKSYEFHPMPGEEQQVIVRVLPQRRPIKILEEGGVLKEEKIQK